MQDIIQQHLGAKITYTSAGFSTGSAAFGWLADNYHALAALGVIVGMFGVFVGVGIQIYTVIRTRQYAKESARRAEELHNAQMARLHDGR